MEDKILELCKRVEKSKNNNWKCYHEFRCDECPFGSKKNNGKYCGRDTHENYIQIARNYIKEHEKTVNTIEKIEEKNKYKVGDKVRVKSDLKADIPYSRVWANHTMLEEKNEILTIEKIVGNKEYRVEENQWLWGEDMFEPVEETVTLKELQEIKKDNIIPTYYHKGNYDVIQFCNDNDIDFTTGNIIKYITRYKYKNGIEDLRKAKEYIRRLEEPKAGVSTMNLVMFTEENNLSYWQGAIIESVIDNNKDLANILIDKLIEKEERK